MSWYSLRNRTTELIEALQSIMSKEDANVIVIALDNWLDEKFGDLEDKINKRGQHDPDW